MAIHSPGKIPNDLQTLFASGRVVDFTDGALLERFVATRDEAAFEVLLARHGPMVLRVCLATLADLDEVDDAFQAVFLILVRRAAAIRSRDSVASWLHGVATRVSARARVDAARRRKHERRSAELAPRTATESGDETDHSAATALHEELSRLPDRYREAIVLCYLESQTCAEAARRLRRPVGTVKARLARARGLLKQRLLRRGVVLPTALIVAGAEAQAATPVSRELWQSTISVVTQAAAPSARVISLTEGVLATMQLLGIRLVAVGSLTAAFAVGAVMVTYGALEPIEAPGVKSTEGTSTAEARVLAVETPVSQDVRLALKQALPAVTASADPYLTTFALIRLAKAQNAAGDRAAALETFVLADQLAGTVPNEHLRRLALMRTAVARGRIGDAAPARATLDRFVRKGKGLGPEARYNLMSMVIDFLFQAGFQDEARANLETELAAVEAIDDPRLKDGGRYRLLTSQLTLGDYEGALRQSARYSGEQSNLRASLLQTIMSYRRASAERPSKEVVERALALSREITFPYPQALAQRDIAAALARAGDIEGGLAIARDIGKNDGTFGSRPSEVPSALAEIAREQIKAGKPVVAIATLREAFATAQENTQKDGVYPDRVRTVAEVQAEAGDIEGAKASVAAIEKDHVEKAQALVALAQVQAKAGEPAAAHTTLRAALADAREIRARANFINDDPAGNADRVFRSIAVAQAETGDAKGALATVAGRGSDAWKSEALAAIAPIQARLGDIAGALATAQSIPESTLSAEAYSSIASLQAKSGDAASALAWATRLAPPAAKAFALIGITEGLAARESEKREQETRKP